MSASKANGSAGSDDAPPSKIPKIPGVSHGASNVENTESSSVEETGDSVSTKHCTKDTGRSCKLTLRIDNLDGFLAAKAEVTGEPGLLSGFKWYLTAEPEGGGLTVGIGCKCDTMHWHCKASYAIRLRSTKKAGRAKESRSVFNNKNGGFAFPQIFSLRELRAERYGYVENNSITLEAELTMYSCYVTDGAYGERTRLHDVAFDFGTQYLHANKGCIPFKLCQSIDMLRPVQSFAEYLASLFINESDFATMCQHRPDFICDLITRRAEKQNNRFWCKKWDGDCECVFVRVSDFTENMLLAWLERHGQAWQNEHTPCMYKEIPMVVVEIKGPHCTYTSLKCANQLY